MPEPITLLTCRDAGALVGCSHTTILRWVKANLLSPHATTHSGIKLFTPSDVMDAKDKAA